MRFTGITLTMRKLILLLVCLTGLNYAGYTQSGGTTMDGQVTIEAGELSGARENSGIWSFKGVPFAKPPVGQLRWAPPQPSDHWEGVKKAIAFGPSPMQKAVFGDMRFRSSGMQEDCLYLNVWTPAKRKTEKLPVLVYFYGGGFIAGDGSEARYDGEQMAKQGIVVLTVNYRLGIFGFFAHPELSKESSYHGSGNYGLLDQHAALVWVKKNIAAFGGDPNKITIAGESAGSIAVSALMASPLSSGLISGAIGESGGMFNPTIPPVNLSDAEQTGLEFARKAQTDDLAELRDLTETELLDKAANLNMMSFPPTIDGYFLKEAPVKVFEKGKQARVPLLLGWNSAETSYQSIMGGKNPGPDEYTEVINSLYGAKAKEVLRLYQGLTTDQVKQVATDLASDRFIVYSTWKWADLHSKTGKRNVYRYVFTLTKPPLSRAYRSQQPGLAGGMLPASAGKQTQEEQLGAPHAFEIEYALGNLALNPVYEWRKEDYRISHDMLRYFASFIRTGNPNIGSLPQWPVVKDNRNAQFLEIGVQTRAVQDKHTGRYLFLDKEYNK